MTRSQGLCRHFVLVKYVNGIRDKAVEIPGLRSTHASRSIVHQLIRNTPAERFTKLVRVFRGASSTSAHLLLVLMCRVAPDRELLKYTPTVANTSNGLLSMELFVVR